MYVFEILDSPGNIFKLYDPVSVTVFQFSKDQIRSCV